MSLSRRILRPACSVLIGALLFAQAAFASRPCIEPGMSVVAAVSAQTNHDCCEPAATELSLCAAQCGDSNKLSGPANPVMLHAVTTTEAAIRLRPRDDGAEASTRLRLQRDIAAAPSPTLRFCRLLI